MKITIQFTIFSLLFLTAFPSKADIIKLKNGETIDAPVVRKDDESLTLEIEGG